MYLPRQARNYLSICFQGDACKNTNRIIVYTLHSFPLFSLKIPPRILPSQPMGARSGGLVAPITGMQPGAHSISVWGVLPALLVPTMSQITPLLISSQTIGEELFEVESHVFMFWFSSVTQSCLTLCDPMDSSTPGLPVHHNSRSYSNSCPLSQ